MSRIAILGNGPAAAYCYRACLDAGATPPDVYAQGRPAFPSGAFWLHWLPPSVNAVYPTSFPTSNRVETAFHPGALYDLLWQPVMRDMRKLRASFDRPCVWMPEGRQE